MCCLFPEKYVILKPLSTDFFTFIDKIFICYLFIQKKMI
ncbi:hypothetical protein B4168_1947 [Anoxybacillus flavithermus]|nr:hypothetical protein B4168_1947 [Anoxybacillus flavithermus]OAO85604.1 hypothetical protein GT23_2507 [Parageobacillus thermoglucosidasius]